MKKLLLSIILVLSLTLSPLGWAGSSDPVIEGKSATDIKIDGGIVNNTPIGSGTPQTGAFTTLSTTSNATIGSGGDPADAGAIRLKNADKIVWEASPAGADIEGIAVDASEVIQIGAAGASGVTITPTLTLVGGQIAFPAAAVPSADPNTLDDFEEGTVTVTFSAGAGTITINTSFDTLAYTKKGREVSIQGYLEVSSVSSPSGTFIVLGFPFTSATLTEEADYSAVVLSLNTLSASIGSPSGYIGSGSTEVIIKGFDGSVLSNIADKIQANTIIILALTYIAA